MFSAILQKHIFGHNFLTKAHRNIILVSRTMFWGSRIQMALFIFSCIWPCLISHFWKAWNWSIYFLSITGISSNFHVLVQVLIIPQVLSCLCVGQIWVLYVRHHFAKTHFGPLHWMMILVSRTMFWGSRNEMEPFILMIDQSVGLSICLSICPFNCPPDYLNEDRLVPACSSVCVPVCLPVHPCVLLPICVSVCPSVLLSVHLPIHQFVWPSI